MEKFIVSSLLSIGVICCMQLILLIGLVEVQDDVPRNEGNNEENEEESAYESEEEGRPNRGDGKFYQSLALDKSNL